MRLLIHAIRVFVESLEQGADRLAFCHECHPPFWLTCKLYIFTEIRYFCFVFPNVFWFKDNNVLDGRDVCVLLIFVFLMPDTQRLLSNLKNKWVNTLMNEWKTLSYQCGNSKLLDYVILLVWPVCNLFLVGKSSTEH